MLRSRGVCVLIKDTDNTKKRMSLFPRDAAVSRSHAQGGAKQQQWYWRKPLVRPTALMHPPTNWSVMRAQKPNSLQNKQ